MPSEFPIKDAQKVWQSQATEPCKMRVDKLRSQAERRRRNGRSTVLFSILLGLFLFIQFARGFAGAHEMAACLGTLSVWSIRIGFAVLCFWSLYVPYWIYHAFPSYPRIWPGRQAPNATMNTTLPYLISEIEKQRDYSRHIWVRGGLTFCFLGMAMVVVPIFIKLMHTLRLLIDLVPVFLIFAIFFAILVSLNNRTRRKLQRAIDQLRALERKNQL